jgi:hypothetical protein
MDALGDGLGDRGTDELLFLRAEEAVLAGVGVEATDGDAWVGAA